MAAGGGRQRGGVIGEDRGRERGGREGGAGKREGGGGCRPRLRKHRVIQRYRDGGRKIGEIEAAVRKKGSQIPTWAEWEEAPID